MLFLGWLSDRGLLRPEDIVEVLRAYIARQKPLGRLAREEGLMTTTGVMAVLAAQTERPDVRFGELAVALGYLDRAGLLRLLDLQARRSARYEDIVLALGFLDAPRLAAARREFLRALEEGELHGRSNREAAAAPPGR